MVLPTRRFYYWAGAKEVFLSGHQDVQSVDAIEGKRNVYSFPKYTKFDVVNDEDYFCRFEYNEVTGKLVPDTISVYCKCRMPCNPDDLMIQYEECTDCRWSRNEGGAEGALDEIYISCMRCGDVHCCFEFDVCRHGRTCNSLF